MNRGLKVFLGCFGAFVVVCGLGGWLLWSNSDFGRAAAQLNAAVANARAAGLPWVAQDLAQNPPVKDSENAAVFVRGADALTHSDAAVKAALSDFGKARTAEDDVAMARSLQRLGPFIALARRAGDKPRCDFHRDWDQGAWLLLPELAVQKQLAQVLAANAVESVIAGRDAEALADLRRAAQIGKHAGSEPSLIGMLVHIACDAIALRGAERVAEVEHANPRALASLRKALSSNASTADFRYALRGEVYMGVSTIRNTRTLAEFRGLTGEVSGGSGETPRRPTTFIRSGLPRTLFGKIFLCRNLQMWTRAFKDLNGVTDPVEMSRILDRIASDEEHAGFSHIVNTILLPTFGQAGQSVTTQTATRSVTRGLISALEYKSVHGRYPKSLAEAGFAELDPFTRKPLSYRVEGKGCKVYSLGPDGQDNGGLRRNELPRNADQSKGWDIVASYPAYRKAK